MAVKQITSWADTTEQTVCSGQCRVTAVEVMRNVSQANEVYLSFWDASNPTPGTTAQKLTLCIPSLTVLPGPHKRIKYVFPNGILNFATACTVHMATTPNGATAPTTTSLPAVTNIYFAIGG